MVLVSTLCKLVVAIGDNRTILIHSWNNNIIIIEYCLLNSIKNLQLLGSYAYEGMIPDLIYLQNDNDSWQLTMHTMLLPTHHDHDK